VINVRQFRKFVVRPVLQALDLWSGDAEELVLATAAHESGLTYLKQIGGGPALGVCQMEPDTQADIWDNYLKYQPVKAGALKALFGPAAGNSRHLTWNLGYAVAMCRLHYCRVKAPLPRASDLPAIAAYWKAHYNTPLGAGTVDEFVQNYKRIVKGGM